MWGLKLKYANIKEILTSACVLKYIKKNFFHDISIVCFNMVSINHHHSFLEGGVNGPTCFRRRRDDIMVNKLSIVGQKCENLVLTGVMPWKTLLLTVRALGRGELSTDRVRGESILEPHETINA